MKNVYFFWKALFVLEILKYLYCFFTLFLSLLTIAGTNVKGHDVIMCLCRHSYCWISLEVIEIWYWNLAGGLSITWGKFLWKNYVEHEYQNLVPDSFLNLVNLTRQPVQVSKSFADTIFWKEIVRNPQKL